MIMPDPSVWADAQKAFDQTQAGPTYLGLPPEARKAIDALGDLLSIYDGHGEDGEG